MAAGTAPEPLADPAREEGDEMRLGAIITGVVLLMLTTTGVAAGHEPETDFPTRSVVVAADFIPAGEPIRPDDLMLREVVIDESNAFALTDPAEAAGTVAAISIVAAQPITPFMLSPLPGAPPPDGALDALSDAEHFGVFWGHTVDMVPRMTTVYQELADAGSTAGPDFEEGDYEGFLAALAADPDLMAARLAPSDRFVAFADDELAWLEAHPPRPCWAEAHERWRSWLESTAALYRSLNSAIRAQDSEALIQAIPDPEAVMTPELDLSLQACW